MTSSPAVSVVIPTYNRAQFLPRAISSALSQEGVDLELLVVDDHSTDGTQQLLGTFGDPRLRTFRNERNEGVSRSRNWAIQEARGRWIAFLDDDDVWAPT